LAVKANKTFGY